MIKGMAMALAAATALTSAAPSYAVLATFSVFNASSPARNIRWERVGTDGGKLYSVSTPSGTAPGEVLVKFSFLDDPLAAFITNVTAKFYLSATTSGTPASLSGSNLFQDVSDGGTFYFKTTAPITIDSTTYAAGSVLLAGSFDHTLLSGARGGSAGSIASSTDGGDTLDFTSDFRSFITTERDFSIALTAINSVLARPSTSSSLRSFYASASGNFSANFVPEPASWAMMLAGFGLVGAAVRRRRSAVVAA
jgi:hypothetical protein